MRLRSPRLEAEPALMIIPMIDIIFFLLVFFMMSTLYMVEQHTFPVNLPPAAASRQDMSRSIDVTVLKDGRVMMGQEEIVLAQLPKRVELAVAKQPDKMIIVRADKQVDYGQVVVVLDELKLAGAHRVALATELKAR